MVFFRSRAAHRAGAYGEGSQPRGRQGPADYDVFEGLPVRRWARQTFVVSQTPKSVDPDGQLGWMQNSSELPMPKDSHLLSPASRALLSSVRAGCKYVKAPERSNRDGGDAKDANGPDGKVAVPFARTFTVGRWAALPRHMDPPEPEYLAKRRSNFVPMTGLTGTGSDLISAGNAKLRRTKFKRTDPATGTVMVYDAAVPEGHTVEGEVIKDEHTAQQPKEEGTIATPSPGTVIEGVGIVDPGGVVIANVDEVLVTPIPRRRFPPKRKFRGAGRGRRKKVMFAHGGGEGYGGGGHQTMSASGLGTTSVSGADDSGRPEDHPTPNGHDDDLDGDNDNYGDESDEDEEMLDRPDSDVHVAEEQQKDLKKEEDFQHPADTTTVDHQPVIPDRVDSSVEEKPPNASAENVEESFIMPSKPEPHITEKPPSPDPSHKPTPNETLGESHNGIHEKSEEIQHNQSQAEEPQQDRPEPTPIQEPNSQPQSHIEPQSELQSEHQLEAQPETQPEIRPEPTNELHQGSPREELPPSPLRFDDGDLDLLGNFDPSTDPAPGRDENEKDS